MTISFLYFAKLALNPPGSQKQQALTLQKEKNRYEISWNYHEHVINPGGGRADGRD